MKINEVLESYNKFLETYREAHDINCKGHFIALTAIIKSMGPWKEFRINIYYIDSNKEKYPFISSSTMEKCPKEKEEQCIDKLSLNALQCFFHHLYADNVFNSIVKDSYGRVE